MAKEKFLLQTEAVTRRYRCSSILMHNSGRSPLLDCDIVECSPKARNESASEGEWPAGGEPSAWQAK